jgi:hypothetical protein
MTSSVRDGLAVRPRLVIVAALIAVGVAAVVAATTRSGSTAVPAVPSGPLPGELTNRAPWPANNGSDLRARLAALGLPALSQEGTLLHVHEHLDVFVRGRRVVVPALIGIDPYARFISPLHTHDATGIIHVESPTVRTFTLGEFFGVWGVRFDSNCLGAYCTGGGSALRVYADGQPVSDPGLLALTAHEEIVVAFGTPGQLPRPVPSSYDFPPGL